MRGSIASNGWRMRSRRRRAALRVGHCHLAYRWPTARRGLCPGAVIAQAGGRHLRGAGGIDRWREAVSQAAPGGPGDLQRTRRCATASKRNPCVRYPRASCPDCSDGRGPLQGRSGSQPSPPDRCRLLCAAGCVPSNLQDPDVRRNRPAATSSRPDSTPPLCASVCDGPPFQRLRPPPSTAATRHRTGRCHARPNAKVSWLHCHGA